MKGRAILLILISLIPVMAFAGIYNVEELANKIDQEKRAIYEQYQNLEMPELVAELETIVPVLLEASQEAGFEGYFPGLTPEMGINDAVALSNDVVALFNVQGNIGGESMWIANWGAAIEKYGDDLEKIHEQMLNKYKAYTITVLMLQDHLTRGNVSESMKIRIPATQKIYLALKDAEELPLIEKAWNMYRKPKQSNLKAEKFRSVISNVPSLSQEEALKTVSEITGSASQNLAEQLNILVNRWADTERPGVLTDKEYLLLFGNGLTKKGLYDLAYNMVKEDSPDKEDLKFFLVVSGALSYYANASISSDFFLRPSDIKVIGEVYSLSLTHMTAGLVREQLSARTDLIRLFDAGYKGMEVSVRK